MATSIQIIEASKDADIRARLVAMAAAEGVQAPENWVAMNLHALIAKDLDGDGDSNPSIASVFEFAVVETRKIARVPRAGENEALVTDALLVSAIQAVRAANGEINP